VANGVTFHGVSFKDDKRRIDYEPPAGWKVDGSANQLRLTPPQNFAEAIISVIPVNKPQTFSENDIKLLQEQFLGALPLGSQFAKIEDTTTNSVLVGGNESLEITVSYQCMGEKFLKSALFVNLKDTQLVFRLTAKKNDFASLHRDFKTSIFSWHWMETTEASAATSSVASSRTPINAP
jgi:hypothetical protein